ncbi:PREDICTED: naringenin,2-oxoglutarate 3-dioxygenase-like [Brassica oleracea var. oleracea]|uniref:Isopenicillin N synthase-like Fe(2+) 2OG dioxygenase domain-containing protein n=1 Tax=Brassica oleracea var. oleracea TaxID=109376 RepID=A0A0D3BY57_BRAOL|nr:PREDICTED: naringenin,2-oxoglutarate 3-dioxygenase-like [Brassica oleracea var. oleracea]
MTRLARDFFALTTEEKLRFHMSGGEGGFSISSHLQGEAMKDWRDVVLYPTYPGWSKVTEYSERLMGLAYKVLEVLSEAMGLEKDALKNACVDMEQKIFVTYFPKRPKPDLALGMRHTDNGILQDQVSCLQVTRDNGKTWVRVPFVPGALVINLGDIGHYLSNGRFMTTDHHKLFINTFLFPAPHATVYPPISYEAITMRKLKDL